MTRGRCGSLRLHRMTLAFTTSRRFSSLVRTAGSLSRGRGARRVSNRRSWRRRSRKSLPIRVRDCVTRGSGARMVAERPPFVCTGQSAQRFEDDTLHEKPCRGYPLVPCQTRPAVPALDLVRQGSSTAVTATPAKADRRSAGLTDMDFSWTSPTQGGANRNT